MRPIAIVADNNKDLSEQIKMVQENAYRDGIDEAIKIVKMARSAEEMIGGNPRVLTALDSLIEKLPILYNDIGIPKEQDSVYERYELHTKDPQMSEREALMREFGAQEDEE